VGSNIVREVHADTEAEAIERAMDILFNVKSRFNAEEKLRDEARQQLETKGRYGNAARTVAIYYNASHQQK
jgi:hypothetical protein